MRRFYLDCDGVLADFDQAFNKAFGHMPRAYEEKHGGTAFWEDISKVPHFYRNLPVMIEGHKIYMALKYHRPIILTGCPSSFDARPDKLDWAERYYPGVPMVCTRSSTKYKYCEPGDVLIDDWNKYSGRWEDAGGIFILHEGDAIKTLHELDQRLSGKR